MRKLVLTLAFMASLSLTAQTRYLTLDDCRQLAVENNAKVTISRGNVEKAKAVKDEAFTKYFPQVQADGLWYRSNKGAIQYTLPTVGEMLPIISELDPALGAQSLGDIELVKKGWSLGVMAIQPVFAGGRIVNGNKLAQVGVQASELEYQNAVDNVALTAETYYWKLVKLKSDMSTLESMIAMTDSLHHQVDVAVRAGVVTRNELLKVDLALNDLKATKVDLDNGITLMRKLMAQYVGLNGDSIDIVDEQVPELVPEFPFDLYVAPDQALLATADYQLLDKQVAAADLEKRMAVGNNLPTVGVGGGYFYDRLFNQDHGFAALMVNVSVPISDWWGGSHAIKQSKIKKHNAELERENLSQLLQLRMTEYWDNLTSTYRKMQIAKESIDASKENLRMNRNFYRAGTVTVTDLLDAQSLYRASVDSYTSAYSDFCVARANYINATGRGSATK